MIKYLFPLMILCTLLASCSSEDEDFRFNEDIKLIEQYIAANALENVQKDDNGLHYIILDPGHAEGRVPLDTSLVLVGYQGRLLNDNIFDQRDSIEFRLNNLVPGFRLATQKIREGGEVLAIMPSILGYGSQARQGIPANSVLIFRIRLWEIR